MEMWDRISLLPRPAARSTLPHPLVESHLGPWTAAADHTRPRRRAHGEQFTHKCVASGKDAMYELKVIYRGGSINEIGDSILLINLAVFNIDL